MDTPAGKLLIVDDEAIIRHSYSRVLSEAGYAVDAVPSGSQAMEVLESGGYDALFTDIRMAEMDGIEVTRRVKQQHPDLPVVIITGYPSQGTAHEAESLGVFQYWPKPIAPEQLVWLAESAVAAFKDVPAGSEVARVVDHGRGDTTGAESAEAAGQHDAVVTEERSTNTGESEVALSPGRAKSLALLISAPFIGGVFVVLMPLIGMGTLLWLGIKSIGAKLGLSGS